jgi:hypothetical protein
MDDSPVDLECSFCSVRVWRFAQEHTHHPVAVEAPNMAVVRSNNSASSAKKGFDDFGCHAAIKFHRQAGRISKICIQHGRDKTNSTTA